MYSFTPTLLFCSQDHTIPLISEGHSQHDDFNDDLQKNYNICLYMFYYSYMFYYIILMFYYYFKISQLCLIQCLISPLSCSSLYNSKHFFVVK